MRGRHLDVDDRDVGIVGAHFAHEVIEVPGLRDDFEARVLKQAGHSCPEQKRIFGKHHAH